MRKYQKSMVSLLLLLVLFLCSCTVNWRENKEEKGQHIPRKFGATYMTMDNPYFVALNECIRDEVEANGDILITRDPAKNQTKQNEQIQEFIDEGVSAIFINPVNWKTITPALEACKEAGIPLFGVDTNVFHSEYLVSTVLSDNYDAGVQIAKDVMEKKESARIVIISEDVVESTKARAQGFVDTIAGHDGYKVVMQRRTTSDLEDSMKLMNEIVNTGLKYDVVLGGNDPTALGILASLQMNHVEKEIAIYGIDGSPDGKAMIKNGMLEGTSAQFPYEIGRKVCVMAYEYLDGEEQEKEVVVPVHLITKENLSEYEVAGWQ